jgi:hypothetical protein
VRKLGILALVLGLAIAFAMPAFAYTQEDGKGNKFMLGGTFATDFGVWNRSKERTGLSGDNTQLMLNVPTDSVIRGFVETGNAGGFFEMGLGTANGAATGVSAGNFDVRKMYGYYKFGNNEFLAGKTDGWIFSIVPQARLGNNLLTKWLYGFGSFFDGRYAQVRYTQEVSKQIRYAISLVANQSVNETFTAPGATTATTRGSYAQIPIIAAKVTMNFGIVSLFPAAAWSQFKWDSLPSGWDDNVTAYYAVLPVKVVAGPFTGLIQMGYGQNIGNMLNPGSATTGGGNTSYWQVYQRVGTSVKNTTAVNGFIDLAWTFGPVTPHVYFGFDNADNNDAWRTGDSNNRRYSYGGSINYIVAPGFMISPELTYFDSGKRPNTVGSPDLGKDWMAGVQFVFAF